MKQQRNTLISNDYRAAMQHVAESYLLRHCDEYLAGDDLLFNACVHHLANAHDVPVFLAQTLAQRAWDELFTAREPVWLGIDWGSGDHTVYLIDRRDDLRYPVPARLLPQQLLNRGPKTP